MTPSILQQEIEKFDDEILIQAHKEVSTHHNMGLSFKYIIFRKNQMIQPAIQKAIEEAEKLNDKFDVVFRYCSECKTYRLSEPNCKHDAVYRHNLRFIDIDKSKQILRDVFGVEEK